MAKNQVNYLMPTMPPAPKSHDEIESIKSGFEYLHREYGRIPIVVQPKHMGSYCLIQLFRDKTVFISRNGYVINHVNMEELLEAAKPIREYYKNDIESEGLVCVEAELMPWSVLGSGLILREYHAYKHIMETLYEHLPNVDKEGVKDYLLRDITGKEFPDHVRKQLAGKAAFESVPLRGLNLFKLSLDNHGQPGTPHFKPFGRVGAPTFEYDLDTSNAFLQTRDYREAEQYARELEDSGHEGVVLKPNTYPEAMVGKVRAFKVRNMTYLHLIYGVDFEKNFWRYWSNRHVGPKIASHIKQFDIAYRMYQIPIDEIPDSKLYKELARKFILRQAYVETLDNRL